MECNLEGARAPPSSGRYAGGGGLSVGTAWEIWSARTQLHYAGFLQSRLKASKVRAAGPSLLAPTSFSRLADVMLVFSGLLSP